MEASITSITTIMDLNDKCLRKIVAFLDPDDLAAVANVCTRFRENAVQSSGSKFKDLNLSQEFSVNDYSKLRNFGKSLHTVRVQGDYSQKSYVKYQKRIIELVVQYCVGEAIELELEKFDITDELALLMQPLLGRVHKLYFSLCQLARVFLRKFSLWSPELRYLQFFSSQLSYDGMQQCGIRQEFPKLKYIELGEIKDVNNSDIAEFMKQNPQLKEFKTVFCDKVDDSIFQSIAKYVPDIEAIHFRTGTKTDRNNIEYLAQLRQLKSIFMHVEDDRSYIPLVIYKIGSANIALEWLNLFHFDITQEFIEGISKLHNLKTLRMCRVDNMTKTHFVEMSKHLKSLSKYAIFDTDLKINQDDLLKLVQTAKRLQSFEYIDGGFPVQMSSKIDVDTFNKLVKTVEQRSEKIPLTLLLSNHFTADIPAKLTEAANEVFKIDIEILE